MPPLRTTVRHFAPNAQPCVGALLRPCASGSRKLAYDLAAKSCPRNEAASSAARLAAQGRKSWDWSKDKTCIVTGGAGSLGLATVRALLAEGAKVMLVDLDADKLARTVRELGTDKAAFVAADVTDAAQTRNYVGETVARWGKIDVLFSNAGNDGPLMPITEYPEDLFDRIIATHVRGCFLACKYTIPQMNDGGSIIITSSIVGVKGVPVQLLLRRRQARADGPDALRRQRGRAAPHPRQQRQSRTGRQSPSCAPPRRRMSTHARPRCRRMVRRADTARPPCRA